jgi:uncharacterized SAM-binding protein YcdF (DUF218 family)
MDTLFFWMSKLVWLLLAPDSLLLILLILAWLLLLRGHYRAGTRLTGTVAVLLTLIALLPVDDWVLSPLETRFAVNPELPETVDGIIVLGGGEEPGMSSLWGRPQTNEAGERFSAFVALARRYPQAQLVFSGGSGNPFDQTHRGADVAKVLLASQGLDLSRLLFERESRNTWENALNTKTLVQPATGQHWLLVTSASHMPRAVGIFCRLGWPVIPYPVDQRSNPGFSFSVGWNPARRLETLNTGAHEWLGLLAYRLSGKTDALLPQPCDGDTTLSPAYRNNASSTTPSTSR